MLLTMDHHTDLHDAFLQKIYNKENDRLDYNYQKELILKTKYEDPDSIEWAIKTNIISSAFVIAYDAGPGDVPRSQEELDDDNFYKENMLKIMLGAAEYPKHKRLYHYQVSNDNIYVPDWGKLKNVPEEGKDYFVNYVIDDSFLKDIFETFFSMNKSYFATTGEFKNKYIMDIDLDYFSTRKSLDPRDRKIFYSLLKNAELITIAKEADCVYECSNGELNADEVLKELCIHIDMALNEC